jgi:hypothetical protein
MCLWTSAGREKNQNGFEGLQDPGKTRAPDGRGACAGPGLNRRVGTPQAVAFRRKIAALGAEGERRPE